VIALLIVFGYTISQFPIPRPKWTRAFVSEAKEDEDELERPSRRVVFWTWCLLSLSCVGLAIAITAVFYPYRRTTATYEVFAWVSRPIRRKVNARLTDGNRPYQRLLSY
jgi:hypothetical protein